jgi:hypothetical protein
VPRLCELYHGICLTTKEKARKKVGVKSAENVTYFDTFVIKGYNIVAPLSDERFVMTVACVQDSTTYLM